MVDINKSITPPATGNNFLALGTALSAGFTGYQKGVKEARADNIADEDRMQRREIFQQRKKTMDQEYERKFGAKANELYDTDQEKKLLEYKAKIEKLEASNMHSSIDAAMTKHLNTGNADAFDDIRKRNPEYFEKYFGQGITRIRNANFSSENSVEKDQIAKARQLIEAKILAATGPEKAKLQKQVGDDPRTKDIEIDPAKFNKRFIAFEHGDGTIEYRDIVTLWAGTDYQKYLDESQRKKMIDMAKVTEAQNKGLSARENEIKEAKRYLATLDGIAEADLTEPQKKRRDVAWDTILGTGAKIRSKKEVAEIKTEGAIEVQGMKGDTAVEVQGMKGDTAVEVQEMKGDTAVEVQGMKGDTAVEVQGMRSGTARAIANLNDNDINKRELTRLYNKKNLTPSEELRLEELAAASKINLKDFKNDRATNYLYDSGYLTKPPTNSKEVTKMLSDIRAKKDLNGQQKTLLKNAAAAIALGNVATRPLDRKLPNENELDLGKSTGFFDKNFFSIARKTGIGNDLNSAEARTAFKQYNVVLRKLISGVAVTPSELKNFNDAFGTDTDQLPILLNSIKTSLRSQAAAINTIYQDNPILAHNMIGKDMYKLRDTIKNINKALAQELGNKYELLDEEEFMPDALKGKASVASVVATPAEPAVIEDTPAPAPAPAPAATEETPVKIDRTSMAEGFKKFGKK